MKQWWNGVSRKKKVLLYFLAVLTMSFLAYWFIGAPALNWQHRYRRIEKAHFVGPGQILGYEEISGSFYDAAVVARTEEGVIITSMISRVRYGEMLFYLPMKGKILVTAAPQILTPSEIDLHEETLTVFVVDDYPEAVRAELDLQLFNLQRRYLDYQVNLGNRIIEMLQSGKQDAPLLAQRLSENKNNFHNISITKFIHKL